MKGEKIEILFLESSFFLKIHQKISFVRTMKTPDFFDQEEAELISAVEAGEFVSDKDFEARKKMLQNASKITTKQRKAIRIRLLESDLRKIKSLAIKKGIPYQTLIVSAVHEFAQQN